jgi:hypothetical protein
MKDIRDFDSGNQNWDEAISAAINSTAHDEPVCLYFPAAIYQLTKPIDLSTRAVVIRGDGIGATELSFASGVSGSIG